MEGAAEGSSCVWRLGLNPLAAAVHISRFTDTDKTRLKADREDWGEGEAGHLNSLELTRTN